MVMMGEKTKSFCLLKVVDTQGKGSCFYRRRLFELASDIVDSNEVQYLGAGWMNAANERGEGGFLTYEILQALSTYLPYRVATLLTGSHGVIELKAPTL